MKRQTTHRSKVSRSSTKIPFHRPPYDSSEYISCEKKIQNRDEKYPHLNLFLTFRKCKNNGFVFLPHDTSANVKGLATFRCLLDYPSVLLQHSGIISGSSYSIRDKLKTMLSRFGRPMYCVRQNLLGHIRSSFHVVNKAKEKLESS